MSNRVAHFEIHSSQPEKTAEFYTAVFGWEIKKWEGGQFEYWMVMTGGKDEAGGINGGLTRRKGNPPEDGAGVSGYVCTVVVDNYDAYAQKILSAGGTIALPKMAIAGMAWQGYFKDNDGNIFGLHQADEKAA
ncbi:MAG: VOC family protein [Candidatus Magasanikbacteria bacterium]|nr:VOC family protein [Candidatus Magasanikbacteria bacterium]